MCDVQCLDLSLSCLTLCWFWEVGWCSSLSCSHGFPNLYRVEYASGLSHLILNVPLWVVNAIDIKSYRVSVTSHPVRLSSSGYLLAYSRTLFFPFSFFSLFLLLLFVFYIDIILSYLYYYILFSFIKGHRGFRNFKKVGRFFERSCINGNHAILLHNRIRRYWWLRYSRPLSVPLFATRLYTLLTEINRVGEHFVVGFYFLAGLRHRNISLAIQSPRLHTLYSAAWQPLVAFLVAPTCVRLSIVPIISIANSTSSIASEQKYRTVPPQVYICLLIWPDLCSYLPNLYLSFVKLFATPAAQPCTTPTQPTLCIHRFRSK